MKAMSEVKRAFEKIYEGRHWGDGETVSGPGSSLFATEKIRDELPRVLKRIGMQPPDWSLLDIPCGDFNWMRECLSAPTSVLPDGYPNPDYFEKYPLVAMRYIGGDIVPELIDRNRNKYPDRDFRELDLISDELPKVDVVFSRDCLVHLPYSAIKKAIKNVVSSGAKWLITTHFPGRVNHDIPTGSWRPLDLTAEPFFLPQPEYIINEGCTEGNGAYADKSLGVWSIDSIREVAAKWNDKPKLTIGMATYRDWPGVWATVQSLKLHSGCWGEFDVIVVDNDPEGKPDQPSEKNHSSKAKDLCTRLGIRYEHYTDVIGTAAAKGRIFELAETQAVMVVDCHVLFPSGTISRLLDFVNASPDSKDLWQGPILTDTGSIMATQYEPKWGSMMYGQWGITPLPENQQPFEIQMHGCGLFACNKHAWPGFHPLLRGFGPEEGHLHARIRRNGGKCLCLPFLQWQHRFGNPDGPVLPGMSPAERLRGYLITMLDTGEPSLASIQEHFSHFMHAEEFNEVVRTTYAEMSGIKTAQQSTEPEPVGTKLKELFEELGVTPPSGCSCTAWINKMNGVGVKGCKGENRAEILAHLSNASKKASWLQMAKIGLAGYLTVESLLDEAIRRASLRSV